MRLIKKAILWFHKKLKILVNKYRIQEEDILERGFEKVSKRGPVIQYRKGEYVLRWNSSNKHNTISLRRGKGLRYFGTVYTPWHLDKVLKLNMK